MGERSAESVEGGCKRQQGTTKMSRRKVLVASSLTCAAVATGSAIWQQRAPSPVFIADGQSYQQDLSKTLREALAGIGWDFSLWRNRTVLIKPNLVEPSRSAPHVTTHPTLVAAAVAVFRSMGAHVVVAEGPGHVRDSDLALEESGLADVIRQERFPFCDLNYEHSVWRVNKGRASSLAGFYFPKSVLEADLVVSMPKLKTHHWMGLTASMKNLYGLLPGLRYGWPKNVLHYAGIPQTVYDLTASVPRTLAIVDAIECMEGDGPVMGTPRWLGAILVGENLVAVDATAARLMGLRPERIPYLQLAGNRLGPLDEAHIPQRGCRWESLQQPFLLPPAPHLQDLRGSMRARGVEPPRE